MSTKELIFKKIDTMSASDIEKLYSFMQIFFADESEQASSLAESQKAFEELEKLRKPFKNPIVDYKEELYEALREKYENI